LEEIEMRTIFIYSITALIALMFVTEVSHGQILYGAATGQTSGDQPSSLYKIDPATGDATLIGPIGFNGVTGLEFLPDGRLIASANNDNEEEGEVIAVLLEINIHTGAGNLIGILGSYNNPNECGRMPDIAFSCDTGQLYGYTDSCNGNTEGLHLINPDDAVASLVGPSGFDDGGNGLAVEPITATIYGTPIDANGLITLDPNTGEGTVIPASIGNVPIAINAMDFNPRTGVLYGSFRDFGNILGNGDKESYLVTINTSDGTLTVIGQTVLGLDAIAFFDDCGSRKIIPTLSEWGMIAMAGLMGIVGFIVTRRRKVTA
jgi:hypothetical protein